MEEKDYPALGFMFKVTSNESPGNMYSTGSDAVDESYFQSISGIKAIVSDSMIFSGGMNNTQYKLPQTTTYPDLILSRGLMRQGSDLAEWCKFLLYKGDTIIIRRIVNVMLLARPDKENMTDIEKNSSCGGGWGRRLGLVCKNWINVQDW